MVTESRREPTTRADRIRSLDVLRGVALLGILVINIRYFSMPLGALNDPSHAAGGLEPVNFWSWLVGTLLFEDKLIALFSMLFGAGVFLTTRRGVLLQGRRMVVLFGIGAFHAYVLWFGDILMLYASLGLVLILVQRLPSRTLLVLGILCVVANPVFRAEPVARGLLQADSASQTTQRSERSVAMRAILEQEEEAHLRMDYSEQFRWRSRLNWWHHFAGARFESLRCGGFMLIGMALLRFGFLAGRLRWGTYAAVAASGLVTGLTLTALGMLPQIERIQEGQEATSSLGAVGEPLAFSLRYLGAGFAALGIAGLVMALCRSGILLGLLRPLAAVGQMALTCYLTHTLVCVITYEGWALGHWGSHTYQSQLTLVGCVLVVQLLLCPLWLVYFRFGPAEWLWRSLTYLRSQPMRLDSR